MILLFVGRAPQPVAAAIAPLSGHAGGQPTVAGARPRGVKNQKTERFASGTLVTGAISPPQASARNHSGHEKGRRQDTGPLSVWISACPYGVLTSTGASNDDARTSGGGKTSGSARW